MGANHSQTKANFIFKAKALANIMSPKGGVKIVIEKNGQPRTDGVSVYIPEGDWSDPVYLALVEWYINHELGHIKRTNFSFLQKANLKSSLFGLWNIIEDVWMERDTCREYPGMTFEMYAGVNHWRDLGRFAQPDESSPPMQQVNSFLLYFGRGVLNGQNLSDYSEEAEGFIRAQAGDDFADSLKALANEITVVNSTENAIALATRIFDLLQNESEDDADDQDENQDSDDDSNDDADDQGENRDSDDDSNDDADGQVEHQTSDEDSKSNDSEKCKAQSFAKAALEGEFEDQPDLHEQLKEEIAKMAEEAQEEGRAGIQCEGNFSPMSLVDIDTIYPAVSSEADKQALAMAQVFNKVRLQTTARVNTSLGRSGSSLDPRLLSGVAAGNFDVFVNTTEQRNIGFNLSVLVDMSGSMNSVENGYQTNMEIANDAAYVLLKSLAQFRDVKTSCYHYPYGNDVLRVKKADSLISKQINLPPEGVYTPTGEAMQTVLLDMVSNANRGTNVLLVITDGQCDFETVIAAKELALQLGVNVCAVGVGGLSALAGFDDNEFELVSDIKDLSQAMQSLIVDHFH